jgi:hypothetical protein
MPSRKYAGTYTERRPFCKTPRIARVFEIKLADGALFLGKRGSRRSRRPVFVNSVWRSSSS